MKALKAPQKPPKSEKKRDLIRNVDEICKIFQAEADFWDVTLVS